LYASIRRVLAQVHKKAQIVAIAGRVDIPIRQVTYLNQTDLGEKKQAR
jgi:hypothetical protein